MLLGAGIFAAAAQAANAPTAAVSPGPQAPTSPASGPTGAAVPASTASTAKPSPLVENSVVKIFSTVRFPDMEKPWTKQAPQEIRGTGVVIDGKHILTNAHMVRYASQIQIQAYRSGDKLTARVEAVDPGIDLAIITVDDPTFYDTHPALPFAPGLPDTKSVMVYGFPTGGDNLSTTEGIVSRIEFTSYSNFSYGLRVQISAAINPGNSGGPAVVDNQMIGLAFSRLGGADNIGYIIPCEEIEIFLKGAAAGNYTGKPAMYDELQTMENPALRPFLKVDKSVHGIIVNQPFYDTPVYPLKKWDIITKIGDTPVDDEGMILVGDKLRLKFQYLIQKIAKDGKVPLTIVRGGKEMPIELPVYTQRPLLIPSLGGKYPSYYIFGPMVFTKATQEFIEQMGGRSFGFYSFIGSPLVTRRGDKPAFPDEELVVVASPFFPDRLDQGYEQDPGGWVVKTVNGIAIKNLKQLVQVLNDSKDDYLRFEFAGDGLESFVFPRVAMQASTEELLTDNGIRTQGSADVMPAAK